MTEFLSFIKGADPGKYDLIKVALAHHRFAWIHPFGNGNGRTVRLLTYTLLIKYGFNVRTGGRVLNPTAVFCNDRDRYYAMLARSEEHTSELQSLMRISYAVFCLKKKIRHTILTNTLRKR